MYIIAVFFLILLILCLVFTLIGLTILQCSGLSFAHADKNNERFMDDNPSLSKISCHSPLVCENHKKVIHDFLTFRPRSPKEQTYFTRKYFVLIGREGRRDGNDNENNEGENVGQAIRTYITVKEQVLDKLMKYLYSQSNFVIIFDKPEFQGKMYLLPTMRSQSWESEVLKPLQFIPHPSKLHLESVTNEPPVTEGFVEGKEKSRIHLPLNDFFRQFQLHYGRKFSCIVPKGIVLEFIPIQQYSTSSETMIIKQGQHSNLSYFISPLLRFSLYTNVKD